MIKLIELLNPYIATAEPPWEHVQQVIMDSKFRKDLYPTRQTDKAVDWLFSIVETSHDEFGALDILAFCDQITTDDHDMTYWENLYAWLQTVSAVPFSTISNAILPTIDLGVMTTITGSELNDLINDKVVMANGATLDISDAKYQVIPEDLLEPLLNANVAYRYKYTADVRDCDDFSRITRGWLSMLGYGNCTVGTAWYYAYNVGDEVLYQHSVLIIAYMGNGGELKTTYAEPQKSFRVWPTDGTPDGYSWGGKVDHIKAGKLFF